MTFHASIILKRCVGDTYPAEVAATVYAVMQRLGFSNPYRLCWQSQVGPSAWLGAQTSDTVQEYVKKGQTDMILIPIAFTSDHIETLFELDQEVIHEAGHPGVKRAESLNDNRVFIEALADVALNHLKSGESCSRQMGLRCQGCKSERCLVSFRTDETGLARADTSKRNKRNFLLDRVTCFPYYNAAFTSDVGSCYSVEYQRERMSASPAI